MHHRSELENLGPREGESPGDWSSLPLRDVPSPTLRDGSSPFFVKFRERVLDHSEGLSAFLANLPQPVISTGYQMRSFADIVSIEIPFVKDRILAVH